MVRFAGMYLIPTNTYFQLLILQTYVLSLYIVYFQDQYLNLSIGEGWGTILEKI